MTDLTKFDLVYLGTPYTKYANGIHHAFVDAAELAARLMVEGVRVYSPIAHTHPLAMFGNIDPLNHEIWLPFDLAVMGKADAMAIGEMDGWEDSYGVRFEIDKFRAARKPIYRVNPRTLEVSTHQ